MKVKTIQPHPHQAEAVTAAIAALSTKNRALIVMPCGTGKTLVGPWIADGIQSSIVVIFVPSLWLLRQTVGQWKSTAEWKDAVFFGICSDQSAFDDLDISEITETNITTNPDVIKAYFSNLNSGKHVVCCTYQSAPVLAEAIPKNFIFDFGVFDEAHCTAGEAYSGISVSGFAVPLFDIHIPIHKRLFMTATPRSYEERKNYDKDNKRYFSMDDAELYGERIYELTFAEAVARGLIADYRIIISVITKQDVTRELLLSNSTDIEAIAHSLALKAASEKYDIRKSILFFNTIDECTTFSNGPVNNLWPEFNHLHISSQMTVTQRASVMDSLSANTKVSVSNARCLTMGIDVPAVDMIAFMRKKRGEIDIVQAVGRASRRDINHPDKIAFIFLPLFLDDAGGEEISDAVNMSGYEQIWTVLEAMRVGDGRFDSWIRLSRAGTSQDNPLWSNAKDGDKISVEVLSQNVDTELIRKSIDAKVIDRLGEGWDEMFGRLVDFKNIHGHCKVPRNYSDKVLARWHRYQVRSWHTRLNSRRKKLLTSLGLNPEIVNIQKRTNALSRRWTKDETNFLVNYLSLTDSQISDVLNRSIASIQVKRANLGLKKDPNKGRKKGLLTTDDDKFIIEHWKNKTDTQIACLLGRHRNTIRDRRILLGLHRCGPSHSKDRRFNDKEDEFIINNNDLSNSEIALALNRACSSIAHRRKHLGLKYSPIKLNSKSWTPEEDQLILDNLDKSYNEVALMLKNRTGAAVYSRRYYILKCKGREDFTSE